VHLFIDPHARYNNHPKKRAFYALYALLHLPSIHEAGVFPVPHNDVACKIYPHKLARLALFRS